MSGHRMLRAEIAGDRNAGWIPDMPDERYGARRRNSNWPSREAPVQTRYGISSTLSNPERIERRVPRVEAEIRRRIEMCSDADPASEDHPRCSRDYLLDDLGRAWARHVSIRNSSAGGQLGQALSWNQTKASTGAWACEQVGRDAQEEELLAPGRDQHNPRRSTTSLHACTGPADLLETGHLSSWRATPSGSCWDVRTISLASRDAEVRFRTAPGHDPVLDPVVCVNCVQDLPSCRSISGTTRSSGVTVSQSPAFATAPGIPHTTLLASSCAITYAPADLRL